MLLLYDFPTRADYTNAYFSYHNVGKDGMSHIRDELLTNPFHNCRLVN